ncbi:hypothetical protein KY361_01725 [Candidatus Woesearchaeota archaeon]|nr:hypothetical protein [Candidatus Woesearchaeota archaeon]
MALSISIKRKSQIWSLDLMVAVLIFLCALLIFYKYSINVIDVEEQGVEHLLLDAKLISSYLVSTGYPEDWTASNVTLIGLTNGEIRLSKEKVQQFSSLALSDYTNSRRLLSTMNDYYISFEDKNGSLFEIEGISSIGKDYSAENPDNLIKVERVVIYNSSIIKLMVHVW